MHTLAKKKCMSPVNLDENMQARLEVLESHDHLVPPRHHKREVKDDSVHRDAFVDQDGLDLCLVQELPWLVGKGWRDEDETQNEGTKKPTHTQQQQQMGTRRRDLSVFLEMKTTSSTVGVIC